MRTSPSIDILHPFQVTIDRPNGLTFFCNTSSNKANFVKCLHIQVRF